MRPAFLLLALTTALCATQAAGEHEEVVDLLQRWWKRAEFWEGLGHPSLGTTALDAGYKHIDAGKFDEAVRVFRMAVKKNRHDVGALVGLGVGLYGTGSNPLATRAMRRAAQLAHESADSFAADAQRARSYNKSATVVTRADEAARLEQMLLAGVYNVLGHVHFESQTWGECIAALEACVSADPTTKEAHEWLARAHDRAGNSHKFISSWENAIKHNPLAQDRNVWPVRGVMGGDGGVMGAEREREDGGDGARGRV